MGWNVYMAVIEDAPASAIVDALKLPPPESEDVGTSSVAFVDATDRRYADAYVGIGRLGDFTLVTSRDVLGHAAWKRFSKKARVLAFWLSENAECNCFEIYQGGELVVTRTETEANTWKGKKHPLEKGTKFGDHKADYIARVFENLTGHALFGVEAAMTLHPAPKSSVEPDALATLRARLEKQLAEPLPPDVDETGEDGGGWQAMVAGIARDRRWRELGECLDGIWDLDPSAGAECVPALIEEASRWPDELRRLPRDRYERVAKGKDDGRSAAIAPMYRSFVFGDGNDIGPYREKALARFVEHPIASELRRLDLSHSWLPAEAAVVFAGAERLANLTHLCVVGTKFGSAGVAALARSPIVTHLRVLDVSRCDLERDGFEELLAAPLTRLEILAAGGNRLGAAGIAALARCAGLVSLRQLVWYLDDGVDAACVRALLGGPNLPALEIIYVSEKTAITAADAAKLSKVRPGVTVTTDHAPDLL